ncbi:MAG: hypothetical protein ACE1Y4_12050 [Lysobacterales bacterium]
MLRTNTLLLLSVLLVIVAGCGGDGTSSRSGSELAVDCSVAVSEPPIWQTAQQEPALVRVVRTFSPADAVAARVNTIDELQAALEGCNRAI